MTGARRPFSCRSKRGAMLLLVAWVMLAGIPLARADDEAPTYADRSDASFHDADRSVGFMIDPLSMALGRSGVEADFALGSSVAVSVAAPSWRGELSKTALLCDLPERGTRSGRVWSAMSAYSASARLKEATEAQSIVTVATVNPKPLTGSSALILPGNLQANSEAPIYARTSGYLKRWLVDIGTPVKAGQLLAMLAPLVMGALGRAQQERGLDAGGLTNLLVGEQEQLKQSAPGVMGALGRFLDRDGDGSVLDDVGGLLGKTFGGKR